MPDWREDVERQLEKVYRDQRKQKHYVEEDHSHVFGYHPMSEWTSDEEYTETHHEKDYYYHPTEHVMYHPTERHY